MKRSLFLPIATVSLALAFPFVAYSTKKGETTSPAATAQRKKTTSSPDKKNPQDSFEEFRAGIYKDFEEFRGRILDHYADFLEGEWHPFESFMVPAKSEKPKPETPPVATPKDKARDSVSTEPIPVVPTKPVQPAIPTKPDKPAEPVKPATPIKPAEPVKPAKPATPVKPAEPVKPAKPVKPEKPATPVKPAEPVKPAKPTKPEKPAEPVKPATPAVPQSPQKPVASTEPVKPDAPTPQTPAQPAEKSGPTFQFYGFDVPLPTAKISLLSDIANDAQAAKQWRALDKSNEGKQLAVQLGKQAAGMGLNGYLTYKLVDSYLRSQHPGVSEFSRQSAAHYLMSQMGFDIRLSYYGNRTPLILMPFSQQVYGSIGVELNGRKYTAVLPEGVTPQDVAGKALYTCQLPSSGTFGDSSDLKIKGLNIPVKPRSFSLSGGGITISGEVNENIKELLYHYPQMPTEDFASSVIDANLRKSVVSQVKSQLSGKSDKEAVNTLMAFFHKMPYATDGDFHGFEKPYFIEENFIYPKNDCEDRAIFFTYLLWNSLGLENQLLAYPGHESAAVAIDENIGGTSYSYDGKRFYSADPTYIGSTVGMCAPDYKRVNPTVDKVYKK